MKTLNFIPGLLTLKKVNVADMKLNSSQYWMAVVKKLSPGAWALAILLPGAPFSYASYSPHTPYASYSADFRSVKSTMEVERFLVSSIKIERFRSANKNDYLLAERDNDNSKKSKDDRKRRSKERWDKLSPEKKERLKQRQQRFEQLPPKEKQRVIRARESYHNMPKEQRQELREKWKNVSSEENKRQRQKKEKKHRPKN